MDETLFIFEWISWIDSLLFSANADLLALAMWALVLSAISILIFKLISPQKKLSSNSKKITAIRADLLNDKVKEELIWQEIALMLKLSLLRVLFSIFPTLLAALPIIFMFFSLEKYYGLGAVNPGTEIAVYFRSSSTSLRLNINGEEVRIKNGGLVKWPLKGNVRVLLESRELIATFDSFDANPVLGLRRWWHVFMPMPGRNSYLSDNPQVSQVTFDLPMRELIDFGPSWIRVWFVWFFMWLFIFSLTFKKIFKVV